tara:strand:+ start:101 stop:517 length:417 start_codon:yes stop_codon:yes gene_type:complete
MKGIHGADKFAEKLRLFQGAADQFNLGQGAAEQFGLDKGAADQFNLGQGVGSVFGAGMSNPGNPLYSGIQQKVQQQTGVNNPFGFAGQLVNYVKDKVMEMRNYEPKVKRDLQGNVISDTGVNENLIELYRNRPDLLRK